MKLFLVHCGFYDSEICDGVYESHINLFSVGNDIEEAKKNVRLEPIFQKKKMHIDGLQELSIINGFRIFLEPTSQFESEVTSYLHRDL